MNREDVFDLLDEAEGLPYSDPRVALCEEAVRIADSLNDDELSIDARIDLITASIFSGNIEKAIVAFTWCLGKYDSDKEKFAGYMKGMWGTDLLWIYKWVCQHTHTFAAISRQQIEETLGDFEKRYDEFGLSHRPVIMQKIRTMYAMGDDPDEVERLFRTYETSARDDYADCQACETSFRMWYRLQTGDYDAAKLIAMPLIQEREGCAEVPHITFSVLCIPAFLNGDPQAKIYQARGYELTRNNRDFAAEMAEHMKFKVLVGKVDEAVAMLERHLSWVSDSRIDSNVLKFFSAGSLVLEVLGDDDVSIRAKIEGSDEGVADAKTLKAFFDSRVATLADAFDQRNGNRIVSTRLAEEREKILNAIA